jgi:hypothetical protein
MTFLRIVISLYLYCSSMLLSENRYPLFRIMLYLVARFTASVGKLESSACRVVMVE